MKKFLATLIALLCFFVYSFAAHITGGEMIYIYLGPGSSANTKKYQITLKLFRDNRCTGCAAMPNNVFIGIFNSDNGTEFNGTYFDVPKTGEFGVPVNPFPPCVNNAPIIDYNVAYFDLIVELPNNALGYTAAYQTCCRVNPLVNVFNANGGGGTGSTYICTIPGTTHIAGGTNSSPTFFMGISLICYNKTFSLNFSAEDRDGDQLVYSFCEAYGGGPAGNANNINPAPPPYNSVPYINGFSPSQPLGPLATIDPLTGIISGIAPDIGKYVVCVCISEYRNGILIGSHRKDFIINVASCDFAGSQLQPSYSSCDGFTDSFVNLNNSPENHTSYWEFGDPASGVNNTSTSFTPTHTYTDTGVYIIKLVVNRGEACSDSTTARVNVFPGFFPGFDNRGVCVNKPTQFTDLTSTVYGTVNSWYWDFGVTTLISDTSRLRNPSYTYSSIDLYTVRFIVGNSKGCLDTVIKQINIIDKPPLSVAFRDTLICVPDAVQLEAIGSGIFSWTPFTNITNQNTATPIVNPSVTTKYYVELDDNGCKNRDSVRVRVVNFVTLQARPDTTICGGDPVRLGAITDGLRFQWTPSSTIDDPTLLNPVAIPLATTSYQIRANIGSCTATDDVTILLIPYPGSNAGNDTTICYNTFAQLNGRIIGTSFSWSPRNTLNNPNILNPIATPFRTTAYVLSCFDTLGCPKPGRDTVLVTMLPKINAFAGNDTAVIVGQPLQLLATGGDFYLWSPSVALNAVNIPDPVAFFSSEIDSIRYRVFVSQGNCIDSAFIKVKIFKTNPLIFVPTAFTPNGDGLNDRVRPIAVGIKNIEYFRIYNRWGQMVFTTTINGYGWDGRINGKPQGTNSYVWLVKAIDYLNRPYFQKGTVTLIR